MVRIKHRYLLLNILFPESEQHPRKSHASALEFLPDIVHFQQPTPDDLTPQLLARAIRDQVFLLYGDYGAGVTNNGLNVKYLSPATSTAIIRCSREHYRLVWAALTYMTHLPKFSRQAQPRPCVMQVVRVSGTIKKSEEEAIRRARAAILKAKREVLGTSTDGLNAVLGQAEPDVAISLLSQSDRRAPTNVDDDDDEEEEAEEDLLESGPEKG